MASFGTRLASLAALAMATLLPCTAAYAAFGPKDLAVIVNLNDPLSVVLAQHYVDARGIPPAQRIEVRLPTDQDRINASRFERVRARVLEATPEHVQAYVLTWTQPFRVNCMSITTAFAAGFDDAWCAKPCALTRPSPYFDSASERPWQDHALRPTMMLAALTEAQGIALIERGIAADGTRPAGTGYLVHTSDKRRNTRVPRFAKLQREWEGPPAVRLLRTDALEGREDVLLYLTGTPHVSALRSNRYLPGAIADHLTSSGGRLVGGRQMSVLRWLEAGVTASYGSVVEPCAYPQKFPDAPVLLAHYAGGDTVIEAYWKSVAMPGQGAFVGEPLARPYSPTRPAGGS